ncbi:uncharacterized protein AB675_11469 [Cyphellophora attinorum]|uniref:Uncharacterized protein n=1 Tax=Cyphellophora attinorum TaxID=1664694 RepID=A0A0N1NYW0_9EURO|nr:uncharacterized protein AB675_11469 [Phialophora attinorum]KPI39865.1 hypothetical protein AB675_11469 [Phialophora attinorum]
MNQDNNGSIGAQNDDSGNARNERAVDPNSITDEAAVDAANTNTSRKRSASDAPLAGQPPLKTKRRDMVDAGTSMAGSRGPGNHDEAVEDSIGDTQAAEQPPPVAHARLAALRLVDNQQNYLTSEGPDDTRLGQLNTTTIGIPVLGPDQTNVGDLVMVHCYERCLGPDDLRQARERLVDGRCQRNHGIVMYFGDLSGPADDHRPVIEKKRYFVVI